MSGSWTGSATREHSHCVESGINTTSDIDPDPQTEDFQNSSSAILLPHFCQTGHGLFLLANDHL